MSVMAQIKTGPFGAPPVKPLLPMTEQALRRVVVDTHASLPDMFEITFYDEGGVLANELLDIGSSVSIAGGAADSTIAPTLVTGEVTSIEAEIRHGMMHTTVRGYDKSHRMQRVKRTYVYRNMKDSDIAQMMMAKYLLVPTTMPPMIDNTDGVHETVTQFNQTDWDFLASRAAENGFDFGVVSGGLYFRKPPKAGGGKLFGLIDLPGGPPTLTGGENLYLFRPRISGAGQVPEVMVRFWDPEQKKAVVEKAKSDTVQVKIDYDGKAKDMFDKFMIPPRIPDIPIPVLIPGTGASIDYGVKEALPTSVNGDVYAVVDRAISNSKAAAGLAKSLAENMASTFAEAEGTCAGNPFVQAGVSVNIENTPGYFTGSWVVTNARHVFDQDDPNESYLTHFVVSGRQDRSILGLTGGGSTATDPPRIEGVVTAICVDNNDPKKKGRVRIALPWLADNYVSDWCRCLQIGMGQKGGWMLLPEPDDEVLVAFEFGDIRRPFVIGGLSNPKDSKKYPVPKVTMGKVEERGFMSRDGHKMVWKEDPTPDPTDSVPKKTTGMLIEDKEGKLKINLDMCQLPAPGSKKIEIEVTGLKGGCKFLLSDDGKITLESTDPTGSITVKGMDITVEAQKDLNLKATANLNVEATANLNLKGAMVNIDSQGPAAIKGKPIQLN